jgi:TolB protein
MGAARFGRNNLLKATLLVVAGVLAACLVAIVGAAGPVGAAFPGENGKIAFQSNRDGNFEIYAMNAGGTGPVNLTNNPARDIEPTVSPDGTKIAFISNRDGNFEIYAMEAADGSGLTKLTNNPAPDLQPAFSPDGTRIAFISDHDGDGQTDIYTMSADGSGPVVRLTNNPSSDFDPAFSADGTKIAFTSHRDGNDEVYAMNAADGSGLVNLTNHPGQDLQPAFSPDGAKIAFRSARDGNWETYTMNADGTGQTNLTNHPAHDLEPAFSPDGTKMAFSSTRDGNYEVYTMNADGSGVERLTNTPDAIEWNSDWGPLATRYDFVGFYAPVDNLPTFNKAKAGSAIPVKFSLGGDQGLDVFAKNATGTATSPTSGPVACDSTAEIDPIETTVSAGSSGLSYDAASDTYTYVWKTHKGWTGCRQLVVEFDDGTVERANFRFVK